MLNGLSVRSGHRCRTTPIGKRSLLLAYGMMSNLLVVASPFVLDGEFWGKLRALLIYKAKAQVP